MGKRKVISKAEIKPRLPNEVCEVLGTDDKLLGYDRIILYKKNQAEWLKNNSYLDAISNFQGAW